MLHNETRHDLETRLVLWRLTHCFIFIKRLYIIVDGLIPLTEATKLVSLLELYVIGKEMSRYLYELA